jgi:hypothetical protein
MKGAMILLAGFAILAATAGTAQAGLFGYGVKAGWVSARVAYSGDAGDLGGDFMDMMNDSVKSRSGLAGGLFLNLGLGPVLSVQPELLYVQKGFDLEIGDIVRVDEFGNPLGTMTAITEVKTSYLEMPVLAKASLPLAGPVRPSLYAGPSLSLKLGSEEKGRILADGQEIWSSSAVRRAQASVGTTSSVFADNMKSVDLGLCLGVEVEVSRFIVDARYGLGLSDILEYQGTGEDTIKIANRTLMVLGGYRF